MSTATYIHAEREWTLTGREAVKGAKRDGGKQLTLVEIRPASSIDPEDRSNNKWVKMEDLYAVVDSE